MLNLSKEYYRKLNEKSEDGLIFKEVKYGDLSTFSYIHGGIDFSDRRTRLARGLTLDENNNIVTIGFEKFFCYKQLETREDYSDDFKEKYTNLQKQEKYRCLEKLDGTLIILGVYKGNLIASTTSSVNNVFTDKALDYFSKLEYKQELIDYMINRNSCLVFEYISLYNQIKVKYNVDQDYIFLAEISKETGDRLKFQLDYFTRAKVYYYTLSELIDIQRNSTGIEGFVIENDYGNLIKVKTDWWYNLNLNTTIFFSRYLTKSTIVSVLKGILNNELDDLYSLQNQNELWKENNKVGTIEKSYNNILKNARELSEKYTNLKDLYLEEKDNEYISLAANIMKGRDINNDVLVKYIQKDLEKRKISNLSWKMWKEDKKVSV